MSKNRNTPAVTKKTTKSKSEKDLELLVNQYLDFAERQAHQHKVMYTQETWVYMTDWKRDQKE